MLKLKEYRDAATRYALILALVGSRGNRTRAAMELRMQRTYLCRLMRKYKLREVDFTRAAQLDLDGRTLMERETSAMIRTLTIE